MHLYGLTALQPYLIKFLWELVQHGGGHCNGIKSEPVETDIKGGGSAFVGGGWQMQWKKEGRNHCVFLAYIILWTSQASQTVVTGAQPTVKPFSDLTSQSTSASITRGCNFTTPQHLLHCLSADPAGIPSIRTTPKLRIVQGWTGILLLLLLLCIRDTGATTSPTTQVSTLLLWTPTEARLTTDPMWLLPTLLAAALPQRHTISGTF